MRIFIAVIETCPHLEETFETSKVNVETTVKKDYRVKTDKNLPYKDENRCIPHASSAVGVTVTTEKGRCIQVFYLDYCLSPKIFGKAAELRFCACRL